MTTRTDNRAGMLVAGFVMQHWSDTIDDGITRTRRTRRERHLPPTLADRINLMPPILPDGVAACVGTDPDSWHATTPGRPEPALARICGECELREPCLQYALDHPDLTGIWAGTTPTERTRMRKAALA